MFWAKRNKFEKELSELRYELSKLQRFVEEHGKIRIGPFPIMCNWDSDPRPTTTVKELLNKILDKLELDITYTPAIDARISLNPKVKVVDNE